jgi:pimeloyl-ACP methyl ester carboxylesterase
MGNILTSRADDLSPACCAQAALLPLTSKGMFSPRAVPERLAKGSPYGLLLRPSQIRAEAQDTATMVSAVRAMQRRYGELRMPVVIMAGTEDRLVNHRKHAVRLRQAIAHSALRLVPGVGHMVHHAVPQQVVDAIEASGNSPTMLRYTAGQVEPPPSAALERSLAARLNQDENQNRTFETL